MRWNFVWISKLSKISQCFSHLNHECEASSITTRWKATHAGQGSSHLLSLGSSCSFRESWWLLYMLSVPVPLCSQFAEASNTWDLGTDDLTGRWIWAQIDAESGASKSIKYKAYTFMIMKIKFLKMLFSPKKEESLPHLALLLWILETWCHENLSLESCDYVKDSFRFVFPILSSVGQRLDLKILKGFVKANIQNSYLSLHQQWIWLLTIKLIITSQFTLQKW